MPPADSQNSRPDFPPALEQAIWELGETAQLAEKAAQEWFASTLAGTVENEYAAALAARLAALHRAVLAEMLTVPDPYAAGRVDQAAGAPDARAWVASAAYRSGLADERTAGVDAELAARAAELGALPEPPCGP